MSAANAGRRLTPHVHVSRVEPWQRVDAVDELVLARRADAVQHGRREVGVGPERVDHLVEGAAAAQQLAYLWVGEDEVGGHPQNPHTPRSW